MGAFFVSVFSLFQKPLLRRHYIQTGVITMSATAVPIPPTSRSVLAKYWVGIALIFAAGAALAWFGTRDVWNKYGAAESFLSDVASSEGLTATESGLLFKEIRGGEGGSPTDSDVVMVELEGKLRDGSVFQPKDAGPMPVNGVIPGFSEALKKMQKGGQYKFWIPPEAGYGPEDQTNPQTGEVAIPGNSVLIFEVTVQDFMPREKFEENMRKQQEAMQKAGGGPGGPAGGPGGQELPPEIRAQIEAQMRAQQQGQ